MEPDGQAPAQKRAGRRSGPSQGCSSPRSLPFPPPRQRGCCCCSYTGKVSSYYGGSCCWEGRGKVFAVGGRLRHRSGGARPPGPTLGGNRAELFQAGGKRARGRSSVSATCRVTERAAPEPPVASVAIWQPPFPLPFPGRAPSSPLRQDPPQRAPPGRRRPPQRLRPSRKRPRSTPPASLGRPHLARRAASSFPSPEETTFIQ